MLGGGMICFAWGLSMIPVAFTDEPYAGEVYVVIQALGSDLSQLHKAQIACFGMLAPKTPEVAFSTQHGKSSSSPRNKRLNLDAQNSEPSSTVPFRKP